MTRERWGVWLIGFAAVASIAVPVAVDLNVTHLFNPDWPGHAKLHDAMSFIMSMGLGGAALWLIWEPERRRGTLLALAAILSAWGWVALIAGGFIPGSTYQNTAEDLPAPSIAGVTIWPNAALSWVIVIAAALGWWLLARGDPARSTRGARRST